MQTWHRPDNRSLFTIFQTCHISIGRAKFYACIFFVIENSILRWTFWGLMKNLQWTNFNQKLFFQCFTCKYGQFKNPYLKIFEFRNFSENQKVWLQCPMRFEPLELQPETSPIIAQQCQLMFQTNDVCTIQIRGSEWCFHFLNFSNWLFFIGLFYLISIIGFWWGWKYTYMQWWIQNFPHGGGANLQGGSKTYYFSNFFPKTAWKWKKWDPKGARVPGAPLRSATDMEFSSENRIFFFPQFHLII